LPLLSSLFKLLEVFAVHFATNHFPRSECAPLIRE
jgi:hypothetical protein